MTTLNASPPQSAHSLGRDLRFDALRLLGSGCVVLGHICDIGLLDADLRARSPVGWWLCHSVDALSRFAVPLFIMISGAVLLTPGRQESLMLFYGRRFRRLLWPIAVWTPFYMWLSAEYLHWRTWPQLWSDLAHGQPYMHLHFIFRMAGLYALTPLLRRLLARTSQQTHWLLALMALAAGCAQSMLVAFQSQRLGAHSAGVWMNTAPLLGYYLMGPLLTRVRLSSRALQGCGALAVVSYLIWLIGSAALMGRYGLSPYPSLGMMLYDFMSAPRIVYSLCLFLLLLQRLRAHHFTHWESVRLRRLAPLTMGIYLIHPLFRELLFMHGYDVRWPHPAVGIVLWTLIVYGLSLISVAALKRLPIVSHWVT